MFVKWEFVTVISLNAPGTAGARTFQVPALVGFALSVCSNWTLLFALATTWSLSESSPSNTHRATCPWKLSTRAFCVGFPG